MIISWLQLRLKQQNCLKETLMLLESMVNPVDVTVYGCFYFYQTPSTLSSSPIDSSVQLFYLKFWDTSVQHFVYLVSLTEFHFFENYLFETEIEADSFLNTLYHELKQLYWVDEESLLFFEEALQYRLDMLKLPYEHLTSVLCDYDGDQTPTLHFNIYQNDVLILSNCVTLNPSEISDQLAQTQPSFRSYALTSINQ